MNRIAALGLAIEEMMEDRDYGTRVVDNAKSLARALDELGVPVRFKERGFTRSHQVLLRIEGEEAKDLCHRLESVGIFMDIGGRLGTAEVTHRGMGPEEMDEIASLICDVFRRKNVDTVREDVLKLAASKW